MKRIIRFWKIIILDTLAVIFMLGAIATGWLPGPGGIPLFIIGLSLLAINHTWAERYIDLLKKHADRLGDIIFIPKLQLFYDIFAPALLGFGIWLLVRHSATWTISLGVSLSFLGVTFFLGNRGRWAKLKQLLKHKQ